MQKLVEPTVESPAPRKLGPSITFAFQKPTSIRPPSKNSQPKPVQIPSKRPLETDIDTDKAPTRLDLIPATDMPSRPTKNENTTRPKPTKAPKPVSKCLLASLFKTTVKLDSGKRALEKPIKTNTTDIAGKKVENWYVSNRARLDLKTRRLMVLAKPTTPRQAMQLKAMRKHHWECGEEVKEGLRRHKPAAYSLKITRDRIDWCKVAPYVALMIQAVGGSLIDLSVFRLRLRLSIIFLTYTHCLLILKLSRRSIWTSTILICQSSGARCACFCSTRTWAQTSVKSYWSPGASMPSMLAGSRLICGERSWSQRQEKPISTELKGQAFGSDISIIAMTTKFCRND